MRMPDAVEEPTACRTPDVAAVSALTDGGISIGVKNCCICSSEVTCTPAAWRFFIAFILFCTAFNLGTP